MNVGLRTIALIAACSTGACSVDSRNVRSSGGSGGNAGAGGLGAAQGGEAGSGAAAGVSGGAGTGGRGGNAGTSGGNGGATSSALDGGSDPSDSGTGGSAGGGTWCDTQTPSEGVAVADFQCLDFETDVPAEVWVPAVTGTATLSETSERAFSPTTSLRSFVPDAELFADRTVATLAWSNVGATAVTGVRVAMQINPVGLNGVTPDWDGSIILACVEFGDGSACLHYTRSDPSLSLPWSFTGGPAFGGTCVVNGSLDFDLWNPVELIVGSDDSIQVLIDGVEATVNCNDATFGVDTVANVTIGLQSRQATFDGWTVYYDDVVVETLR